MAQIFHPSANFVAKTTIFGAAFILAGGVWIADKIQRSGYVTGVDVPVEQPIPFNHKHHVQQVGLDCRYCHGSVEEAAYAGFPPTKTCMTCHSQLFTDAPMLEPARESWRTGESIAWVKVHDLPDFAYFDHSIHVAKGVGCTSCHGEIDEMPLVWQENTLHMGWCLDCHRAPEKNVRPREHVFDMDWETPVAREELPEEIQAWLADAGVESETVTQSQLGPVLVDRYDIATAQLENCSVCHR